MMIVSLKPLGYTTMSRIVALNNVDRVVEREFQFFEFVENVPNIDGTAADHAYHQQRDRRQAPALKLPCHCCESFRMQFFTVLNSRWAFTLGSCG